MAYTYRVETNYRTGVPQTIFLNGAGPFRGISCHWTAGASGRNGALGTVQFLIDRADRNASYHEIWYWENKTFGVIRVVRPERASHSMNPQPPTWSPSSLVRRILGDKVGDPNRYAYSVSFAGMPADLDRAMNDPDFVQAASRRISELYKEFPSLVDDPLFNHGEGQPSTRTDWGGKLRPAIYSTLAGEDMGYMDTAVIVVNREFYIREGATARSSPSFNPNDFDSNKITVHGGAHWRPVLMYVTGTDLRGPNGEVYSTDKRWFAGAQADGKGVAWYHWQDRVRTRPIETVKVEVPDATLQAKIEDQAEIIATQKTEIAGLSGRIAKKNAKADELKAI